MSAFISVDLPTLGRPTIATWPQRNSGAVVSGAATRRSALALRHQQTRRLGGRLLRGAPARAPARGRRAQARESGTRLRTAARAPRRWSWSRRIPAPAGAAPAAIPAAASSDPCRAPPDRPAPARRRSRSTITARAASKPPSRNTAPNTASSASARIDGRSAPPLFSSPSPSSISLPSPSVRATRASVSWLTSAARTRDRSPSGNAGKRSNSATPMTQLSTASPTNSSRSLCDAPTLRCVSAWRSRSGWRNV